MDKAIDRHQLEAPQVSVGGFNAANARQVRPFLGPRDALIPPPPQKNPFAKILNFGVRVTSGSRGVGRNWRGGGGGLLIEPFLREWGSGQGALLVHPPPPPPP